MKGRKVGNRGERRQVEPLIEVQVDVLENAMDPALVLNATVVREHGSACDRRGTRQPCLDFEMSTSRGLVACRVTAMRGVRFLRQDP